MASSCSASAVGLRGPGGPTVLELRANGIFVMDTAEHASEQALADAGLARVATPRRVLVGGLGLGFTLDRVLGDRRVEHVDVVEIEPALVEWMRDGTIPHGPRLLADSRARVVVADIVQAVAEAGPTTYDVVLLDVDNGPGPAGAHGQRHDLRRALPPHRPRAAGARRRPGGLVRRTRTRTSPPRCGPCSARSRSTTTRSASRTGTSTTGSTRLSASSRQLRVASVA